jgi:hypothetical protein
MPGAGSFKASVKRYFTGDNLVNLSRAVVLLFALNLLDALVTVFWVKGGLAPETNQIMAWVLDIGPGSFLLVKLAMGSITAGVLLYGSQYRLAKIGVTLALFAYGGAFVTHVFTGLAAAGYLS